MLGAQERVFLHPREIVLYTVGRRKAVLVYREQVATDWICSCVTLGTTRTRFSVMTRSNGDEAAESILDKRRGSVTQNKSEGRCEL